MPEKVGKTVLDIENNDGVSVGELRTMLFATGLRDRRFKVDYE